MALALIRPVPGRLTDRQVRRGLRLNIVAGSFGMVWVAAALNMPFVMLLEALGASGVVLGVSTTVRQLALMAQIPSSLVLERLTSRKAAWATLACIHRLLWLVPAWLAWRMPHSPIAINLILAAVMLSTVIESFATPAWFSWMADLVPEEVRGRFWSTRQAVVMTFFLLAVGVAGVVLDQFPQGAGVSLNGFALVFAAAALFGTADILIHLGVPEPVPKARRLDKSWFERIILPLQHPSFRNLAISMGIWMFACAMSGTFTGVYLKREFGASYSGLSALTICGSVSTILASVVSSYLVDRIGPRAFAVVLMCVAPVFGISWFVVTAAPIAIPLPFIGTFHTTQALLVACGTSLLGGGVYGAVGLCHLSLLGALAPKRGRMLAMAVHWTLVGLVGAAGPVVGGYIVDALTAFPPRMQLLGGTHLSYAQVLAVLHAALIWIVAVPFMLRVRARRDPLSVAEAFDRVVMVNPLRFASGVYHARVLASPSRRARRQQAALAIGEAGAEIAIAELVSKLDDPTSDVREAATVALGRLGSPEALQALLHKLDDPSTDLTAAVLRALRLAPEHSLVPRLTALLAHADTEIVREAVHTLGTIGDARAVGPLVEVLHRSRSDGLIVTTAEALGRLGDVSAIYVILPRLRTTRSPFLRRALAVACSDLLGSADGFYRVLLREEAAHGSGVAPLLHQTHQALRRTRRNHPPEQLAVMHRYLKEFDPLYEQRAIGACAHSCFRLAELLAELRLGICNPGSVPQFLTALDARDPHFTVGVWFLAILDGAFARSDASTSLAPAQDLLEIQLAIYLIASWAHELAHPPGRVRPCTLSLTGATIAPPAAVPANPAPAA